MLMPAGQSHWRPATTPDSLPLFLDVPYLLSGNTAVKRAVFEKVGGFDESLHRCEDIAIGFALQKQGFSIGYAPTATIHYRHRASLKGLVVQHYHYGKGMSQVLVRYGLPKQGHTDGHKPSGVGLLKPNKNPGAGFSMVRVLRRTGTLTGRLVGLAQERVRGTARA
jgi:cellulose synthase/poly-beta-1,6-N-acetylglucosamine synthase-like glycosyltransferase